MVGHSGGRLDGSEHQAPARSVRTGETRTEGCGPEEQERFRPVGYSGPARVPTRARPGIRGDGRVAPR